MGWLTKYFTRRVGDRIHHQLSEAARLVQIATYHRLIQRYGSMAGAAQESSRRLARAVSSELFSLQAENGTHDTFRTRSAGLIEVKLAELKSDQELRRAVTMALLAMMKVHLYQLGLQDATRIDDEERTKLLEPYEHLCKLGLADETVSDANPDIFLPLALRYYEDNAPSGDGGHESAVGKSTDHE